MAIDWIEFALNVVGGSMAFLCLFEGVRRLGRNGWRRGPFLTALLGLVFFAQYGAFAVWRHLDATDSLGARYQKPAAQEKAAPLDATRARAAFIGSGLMPSYLERGEKKSYAPTQDDVRRRERVVATNTLLSLTARASLYEAMLWGILALVAALAGYLFSREKEAPRA
jgi:hypothetical protein